MAMTGVPYRKHVATGQPSPCAILQPSDVKLSLMPSLTTRAAIVKQRDRPASSEWPSPTARNADCPCTSYSSSPDDSAHDTIEMWTAI